MNKILILFAHPRFETSRANRALLRDIGRLDGITVRDLYEEYADFNIDAEREKLLLLDHQVIIWQHPFYNYGPPALIKQWIDVVLEYGWAHGRGGDYLRDRIVFNVLTAGGTRQAYSSGGHGCALRVFLSPFEQTARLCGMHYLPPLVVHGTFLLDDKEMKAYGKLYSSLLKLLTRGQCNPETAQAHEYLNDWLAVQNLADVI